MATEDESVYELSRRIDLFIGFGSAIGVLIAIFTLLYLGNEPQEIRPIFGIASLSVISIFFLISYFLVNTINLTNDKIVFLPCGHEILLPDIDLIKNASEFRSEAGAVCPARIELVANVNRLKWMPFNALWIGKSILIRTYGLSASRFVEELDKKLFNQRRL